MIEKIKEMPITEGMLFNLNMKTKEELLNEIVVKFDNIFMICK